MLEVSALGKITCLCNLVNIQESTERRRKFWGKLKRERGEKGLITSAAESGENVEWERIKMMECVKGAVGQGKEIPHEVWYRITEHPRTRWICCSACLGTWLCALSSYLALESY